MTASSPTALDPQRSSRRRLAGAKTRTSGRTLLPLTTAVGGAALGLAADLWVRTLTRGKLMRTLDRCTPLDDDDPDQVQVMSAPGGGPHS